jgi:hypothetical protein
MLRGVQKPIGYEILRILAKLVLRQDLSQPLDGLGTDDIESDAEPDLYQRMQALQDSADLKDAVKPILGETIVGIPFKAHQCLP